MAEGAQERLRATFEEVPELYDRSRPEYPPEVFDDLVALARLSPPARLLEIGCGTGRATLPLAERGYSVTCVELGERLAAVARRTLERYPHVEVVTADFETWEPGRAAFDAVVSFSAFHWIGSELRYVKTADLLREHGALGFLSLAHVLPADGDPFFVDVQADYEAVVADRPRSRPGAFYSPPWRLPDPAALADHSDAVVFAELEASGRYRLAGAKRYLWDVVYTGDEHVAVLDTYSHHRAFDEETRRRLYERIRRRIDARPERTVRTTYLGLLYVAERA